MLKAVLDKIDDLPESDRAHYKQAEGGGFVLDVDGLDDEARPHPGVGALVRAKKREAENRGKAEVALKELREKLEAATAEREQLLKGVVPKDNVDRLEASYKEKLQSREAELNTEIKRLDASLREVLVDNVAHTIAAKLANDPVYVPIIVREIVPRLSVEIGADGKASTRVLDNEGKPSAHTLDDLSKEIVANPMFAAVVLGSRATGGGADSSSGGAGGPPSKLDLSKATLAEKEAYYKARRQQ